MCPYSTGWSGPFTYAFYDTRLIRRSNWLLADLGEDPYGRRFNYTEHLLFPSEEVSERAPPALDSYSLIRIASDGKKRNDRLINISLLLFAPQFAKELAASATSSKKEEEKLKKEGRLYKVRPEQCVCTLGSFPASVTNMDFVYTPLSRVCAARRRPREGSPRQTLH